MERQRAPPALQAGAPPRGASPSFARCSTTGGGGPSPARGPARRTTPRAILERRPPARGPAAASRTSCGGTRRPPARPGAGPAGMLPMFTFVAAPRPPGGRAPSAMPHASRRPGSPARGRGWLLRHPARAHGGLPSARPGEGGRRLFLPARACCPLAPGHGRAPSRRSGCPPEGKLRRGGTLSGTSATSASGTPEAPGWAGRSPASLRAQRPSSPRASPRRSIARSRFSMLVA